MRKLIWITGTAVLALCLLLLLLKSTEKADLPKESKMINEQSPSRRVQSQAVESALAMSPSATRPDLEGEMARHRTVSASNAYIQERLALWQAPIEFYGKVVDENSNAVSGASIHFRWIETPAEDGEKTEDTQTDSGGLFSLHGKLGRSLMVQFSKNGYVSSQGGQKGFLYALGQDIHSPDPQNPVIFTMRKKGTPEPLLAMKRNYRIPRDGTPLSIDLSTGETANGENGDFVVRCWTKDEGKLSGQKYDWRCVITVPNGGLVLSDEEFPFLAVENGYKPSTEINMPADRPDWKNDVDLKVFFRVADGRYGRMKFSMVAGGQHFCMIDSVLNLTGSRSLEPINIKQQEPALPPCVTRSIPEHK